MNPLLAAGRLPVAVAALVSTTCHHTVVCFNCRASHGFNKYHFARANLIHSIFLHCTTKEENIGTSTRVLHFHQRHLEMGPININDNFRPTSYWNISKFNPFPLKKEVIFQSHVLTLIPQSFFYHQQKVKF